MSPDLYIICPLEIEARALLTLDRVDPARLLISGPGQAVTGAVAQAKAAGAKSVLLAGFCAGLAATPIAPPIAEVRTEDGAARRATIRTGTARAVSIVGVDRLLTTPRHKAALRAKCGAELADTESHHFAAACEEMGLAWGVVRAVSDGPQDALPEESAGWIDAEGRTRTAQVMLDVVRRPSLVGRVRTLARASRLAAAGLRDGVSEAIG